jgi:preflagellin peptidase FlaK
LQPQLLLDLARTAVALFFLFYASWRDYKSREVSNTVWVVFAPLALALTFSEIYFYGSSQLPFYGVCFGLTALFAVIIFYTGGFGGADAKALMCLALILPFYPANLPGPLTGEPSPVSQTFFPLSIFSNSVLLAALMTVALLAYNLLWRYRTGGKLFEGSYENASLGRKILVLITGYKVSVTKLKQKWHVYPLEDVAEESESHIKRKLMTFPKDEGREAIVERLEKAVQGGAIQDGVWATPGLPFLIFMTAGLVLGLVVGDIVWTCIRLVLA